MTPVKKDSSLRGKVALVTGGSRGIGLAVARALAQEECRVIITGRDAAALKRLSKLSHVSQKRRDMGHPETNLLHVSRKRRNVGRPEKQMLGIACDVRDAVSVQQLCVAIEGRYHRLDILINNAGIAHGMRTVQELEPSIWQEVVETNLTGMFLMTRYALPLMGEGSTIVNNLSIAAERVFPGQSAYIASKHGALGFTNALREELRPRRVRVISLLPGATDTALWDELWPDAPRKKMVSPETVATMLVSALKTPPESTVEELTILPSAGTL